jgi:hypothetical protein
MIHQTATDAVMFAIDEATGGRRQPTFAVPKAA